MAFSFLYLAVRALLGALVRRRRGLVLLAFSAVLAAIGISAVGSHVVPASDSTKSVMLLIGMAVGIDYSLFYLRRAREQRAAGHSPRDALVKASRTPGTRCWCRA